MASGMIDDTFLHIVDAWWQGEVARQDAGGLPDDDLAHEEASAEIQRDLDAFIACKGDRFRDSADLALHFEEWKALFGGSKHPEGCRLIADVLRVWRSIEPQRPRPAKPRG
jgi:hypothetical protein